MGEQLSNFSAVLELFLNVLEFSALIVSAITFFILMLNQYSKALKQILGPCGIGFGARLRVLFLCRKSPVKKRAFLEFAILKTQGRSVLKSDWRQIIGEFKASYSEQSEMRYSVSNCTSLIGDDLSAAGFAYIRA